MILDKDSDLKVQVVKESLQDIGNDEVYDYKVYMNVHKIGFLHESRIKAGKPIKQHAHAGDILNFVMEGSITINGKTYAKGDWYMTTTGTFYSGIVNEDLHILMICSFAEEAKTGGAHIEAWVIPDPKG